MNKLIKILSIEDDEFMRFFLKDTFWIHGKDGDFNVDNFEVVDNIKKAEAIITNPETKPDLILLDVMLPQDQGEVVDKEAGFKFLKKIKNDPKTKDIKVIIFSAYKDKEINDKALKLGAEKFLIKGENLPQDLIKAVRELFC